MLCISPRVWSALGSKSCSASPSSPASSSDSSPGDDDDQADFDYYADHDNDDWNDYDDNHFDGVAGAELSQGFIGKPRVGLDLNFRRSTPLPAVTKFHEKKVYEYF